MNKGNFLAQFGLLMIICLIISVLAHVFFTIGRQSIDDCYKISNIEKQLCIKNIGRYKNQYIVEYKIKNMEIRKKEQTY